MIRLRPNPIQVKALVASILLYSSGIVTGAVGLALVGRYTIEYYFKSVPQPGLEAALAMVRRDYDLNEFQVSTIRSAATNLLEEFRVEAMERDVRLDRRILDFVRDFKRDLNPEQGKKLDRDSLVYLYSKRPKLFRQLFTALKLDGDQIVAIDDLFAGALSSLRRNSVGYQDIPPTLLYDLHQEIRNLLREDQRPAFEAFLATVGKPR